MAENATTKTTRELAKDAGANLPADHLAEAEATNGEVTVEHEGFTFEFNPRAVTDYRLQRRLTRQEPDAVARLIEIVLGDQEDDVVEALEGDDGYVDTKDVMQFVNAVCEGAGLGKR